jgi:hypothetical protein
MITLILTLIIFFVILFALPEKTVTDFHRSVRKKIKEFTDR